MENLKVEKAQKCYKSVLAQAGATLPRRDAIDARIVYETKSGTGRYINTDHEVGGYPCLVSEKRAADWDSDGDGMPETISGSKATGFTWTGNDEDGYSAAAASYGCKNDSSHTDNVAAQLEIERTEPTTESEVKTGWQTITRSRWTVQTH